MADAKFKFRLGASDHILLQGTPWKAVKAGGLYECRLHLRSGPLQTTARAFYSLPEVCEFAAGVMKLVCTLDGEVELSNGSSKNCIRVSIGDLGEVRTQVKLQREPSGISSMPSWSVEAQFHTKWADYFRPLDVEYLKLGELYGPNWHVPSIRPTADEQKLNKGEH